DEPRDVGGPLAHGALRAGEELTGSRAAERRHMNPRARRLDFFTGSQPPLGSRSRKYATSVVTPPRSARNTRKRKSRTARPRNRTNPPPVPRPLRTTAAWARPNSQRESE